MFLKRVRSTSTSRDTRTALAFLGLPITNHLIDIGGLIALLLVIFGVIYKIRTGALHHFSRWRVFDSQANQPKRSSRYVLSSLLTVFVREVFVFNVLGTCNKIKRLSHVAIFWGFVFLAISTLLAFLTNPSDLVLPLYNPVKIFGNVGGILVVIGFMAMFYSRSREGAPILKVTRTDFFILILLFAVLTGFLTQQAVYSSLGSEWISATFWLHMVVVVALLVTAPFTKFFHAISKPVSLVQDEIDKQSGAESYLPSEGPPMTLEKKEP